MITWLNRILYAVGVVLGFMLVFLVADGYYREQNLNQFIEEAYENNEYEKFLASRYYDEDPVFVIDNNEYEIYFYNIGFYNTNESDEVITLDSISIVMILKGDMTLNNADEVIIKSEHVENKYLLVKYGKHSLYTVIDQEVPNAVINPIDFTHEDQIESLKSFQIKSGDTIVIDEVISIDSNDFIVADALYQYYEDNGTYLKESNDTISVLNQSFENPVETWFWVAGYTILAIGVTIGFKYLQQFKKGKREVSPGLQKDINKLNQEDKSKTTD